MRTRIKGFTLIELMVALALFGVAVLSMARVFANNISQNTRNERITEAIEVGTRFLDELRVQDPTTMPTSGATSVESYTIGSRQYDVTATYCGTGATCTTNLRQIHIDVKHKSILYYSVDTIFTQLR